MHTLDAMLKQTQQPLSVATPEMNDRFVCDAQLLTPQQQCGSYICISMSCSDIESDMALGAATDHGILDVTATHADACVTSTLLPWSSWSSQTRLSFISAMLHCLPDWNGPVTLYMPALHMSYVRAPVSIKPL